MCGELRVQGSKFIRNFLWAPVVAMTMILVVAGLDFFARTHSTDMEDGGIGVVFTGQFVRVRVGLTLMDNGQFDRLYLSGVNPRAGMTTTGFADQFDLNEKLRKDLLEGRLVLGGQADSTFANALETRCWLDENPTQLPIFLLTSSDHMPRASLMLEFALDGRRVERISIFEDPSDFRDYTVEFGKYLASRIVTYWKRMRGDRVGECQQGSISN